jgi:hypothetical protein
MAIGNAYFYYKFNGTDYSDSIEYTVKDGSYTWLIADNDTNKGAFYFSYAGIYGDNEEATLKISVDLSNTNLAFSNTNKAIKIVIHWDDGAT